MIIRSGLSGFAVVLALGVSLPAMAADLVMDEPAPAVVEEESVVTLSGGVGVIGLEANEIVYVNSTSDDHLSLLIWQSMAPVLTAGLDIDLPEGFTFSAKAQVALGGDSYMEDYDWFGPYFVDYGDDNWTHRSQHEDTDLDYYFNGSLLVGYNVVNQDDLKVNVNGGFKYTDVQWAATGGSYVYSTSGYRADQGDFADEPAITYRQQFPAVIAGIDAEMQQDAWTFGVSAHAGVTFSALADDHHWMRDIDFIDNLEPAGLLQAGASVGYEISEGLTLFAEGTVEQIFTGRGDTDQYNIPTGNYITTTEGTGGGDLFAGTLSIGIKGSL